MNPKYQPGQFLVRLPEYEGWGMARFLRVGTTYSDAITDLYYTTSWGMQLGTRGAWVWGPSREFAAQTAEAVLDTYYQPATEGECAALAEQLLRHQQDEWNARWPQFASQIEIRSFPPARVAR